MTREPRVLVHVTHGKTELFLRALAAAGVGEDDVFVICSQPTETSTVKRMTSRHRRIFPAEVPDRAATPWLGSRPSDLVESLSHGIGLTPLDLILADRHLRRRPADSAMHWLNTTADLYSDILDHWAPAFVVGETASASEVVLASLSARRELPYVQPATMRIPGNRFGLWLGSHADALWERPRDKVRDSGGSEELQKWLKEPAPPFYFAPNSRPPALRSRQVVTSGVRVVSRLASRPRHAMQYPKFSDYLTLPWLNRVTKARYAQRTSLIKWSPPPESPFVFFPLHVQPESSIDFYPSLWRNQLESARIFAAMLRPMGIAMVVKDHPNFLWSRGEFFHRDLLGSENVHAVSPEMSSRTLMESAEATVTVSGTIALEAGLRGRRAIMVSRHPWEKLPTVERIGHHAELPALLARPGPAPDPQSVEDWYGEYRGNSWPGFIADKFRFPHVLSTENIWRLGSAFSELLESTPYETRSHQSTTSDGKLPLKLRWKTLL